MTENIMIENAYIGYIS